MRKLLTIFGLALAALPAWADEYKIKTSYAEAQFAIALPAGWRVSDSTGSEIFFSTGVEGYGAAANLISASVPLADQRVAKRIDLSNRVVTRDTMIQQADFPARRIDGTAVSEGDKLSFSCIALKPTADAAIIQLNVWGPSNLWQRADLKRQVEDMLGSLKPVVGPSK
jgi:hypothetical protein